MIDDDLVFEHRRRALNPERPVIRGVAQNADVYFQGRETVNPYYGAVPGAVQTSMDRFANLTGRQYKLFEYFGVADPDRVIVLMGSGADSAHETIDYMNARGARLGLVQVHLFRPFSVDRSARCRARHCARRLRCWIAARSPGAQANRCTRMSSPRSPKVWPAIAGHRCRASWADDTACHRRNSRRRWSRRCSTTWPRSRRSPTSRWASPTTCRTPA